MSVPSVLPPGTRPFLRALEQAQALEPRVNEGVEAIRNVKGTGPASFLPFLVYEYGLISLSPYVESLYTLLREGRLWQIERGTLASVARALSWIESPGLLVEAPATRRWWNHFQLKLNTLPPDDGPGLDRIAEALRLSVPMQSDFRRGAHIYDVPMLVLDGQRLDGAMTDSDSGVSVKANGARWSFGQVHEFAHTLTAAEGLELGNWLEPSEDDAPLRWVDAAFPWTSAAFPWAASASAARRRALASWFAEKVPYLCLSDGNGVIGYRRARVCRPVQASAAGVYGFESSKLSPSRSGDGVYIEAMTGFGDGAPRSVTGVALVFAPTLAAPPGTLWLEPDEIDGGTAIAAAPVPTPIELRPTLRQQFKFLLRF